MLVAGDGDGIIYIYSLVHPYGLITIINGHTEEITSLYAIMKGMYRYDDDDCYEDDYYEDDYDEMMMMTMILMMMRIMVMMVMMMRIILMVMRMIMFLTI